MFTIWIDEEGFYSTEDRGILAEVEEMPVVDNARHLKAYRYNKETKRLELDEKRLLQINNERATEVVLPTDAERIEALEAALLELTSMILGGN